MKIEVYQTIKEKDGTISAYLRFLDDTTNEKIKAVCVQGKTQLEFETNIKKVKNKILVEESENLAAREIVSKAIANIKQEEIK